MKYPNTLMAKLLQFVRDNPGTTGSDIHKNFRSLGSKNSISATLGKLRRMGLIENQGPVGTRWSVWYPVKFETPDPKFLEKANHILEDLALIPKSERPAFLARCLEGKDD